MILLVVWIFCTTIISLQFSIRIYFCRKLLRSKPEKVCYSANFLSIVAYFLLIRKRDRQIWAHLFYPTLRRLYWKKKFSVLCYLQNHDQTNNSSTYFNRLSNTNRLCNSHADYWRHVTVNPNSFEYRNKLSIERSPGSSHWNQFWKAQPERRLFK